MPRENKATIGVEEIFERAADALAPLGAGARLLLACSAGGDSMALLDLAARAAAGRRWALAVAHVDHAQRPESGEEARFVAERAAGLGIPVFIERLRIDRSTGGTPVPRTEDAMRQARHGVLRRFAGVWEADAVVLAHQADDQAETFLIRLLAGAGPTGLGSIRPVERIEGLTLARPLLGARRVALRDYLRGRGLDWRDDPTNEDLAGKRSWIRGALLPLVGEKIGLDPTARLCRAAELIREEGAVLEETIGVFLRRLSLAVPEGALARLDLGHALWREAGELVRRQLLRQWIWGLRRSPLPPGYEAIQEALAFVQSGRPLAELRTVERIHIVHCKTSLVAFAPEVDKAARRGAAEPLLPEKPEKKKK